MINETLKVIMLGAVGIRQNGKAAAHSGQGKNRIHRIIAK